MSNAEEYVSIELFNALPFEIESSKVKSLLGLYNDIDLVVDIDIEGAQSKNYKLTIQNKTTHSLSDFFMHSRDVLGPQAFTQSDHWEPDVPMEMTPYLFVGKFPPEHKAICVLEGISSADHLSCRNTSAYFKIQGADGWFKKSVTVSLAWKHQSNSMIQVQPTSEVIRWKKNVIYCFVFWFVLAVYVIFHESTRAT
ncbi:MAG: hypothetical protein CFE39_15545 [Comamonadaceae bacterium PBBC2]|nr:MAG: hypothetical protein CFE39_15545 [Comamonadaceae bacterium PBBC2]